MGSRENNANLLEGDDAWAVTGQSWHWQPVIADDVYEGNK
jgi:type VI secretion system secreted protein VgrG